MDIVKHNEIVGDKQSSDAESPLVQPVGSAEVEAARRGDWQVILTPTKTVPEHWFGDIRDKDVLLSIRWRPTSAYLCRCRSAGNKLRQFAPTTCKRPARGRAGELTHPVRAGDMADLSRFEDESFDLIFHPVSNVFSQHILPVWRHCALVLRPRWALAERIHEPRLFYV